MPTYEYRCKSCGHELEDFQKITAPALKLCPQCHKEELERLISGGNFVLKGSGWYKDLYSSSKAPEKKSGGGDKAEKSEKADKPAEKSESAPKKSESKPGEAA